MRLIGDFPDERKAYTFCQILGQKGIEASYEAVPDHHRVWIIEEDDFERACQYLEEFYKLPEDQQRKSERPKILPKVPSGIMAPPRNKKNEGSPYAHIPLGPRFRRPRNVRHPMTNFLLIICAILFFWNLGQETRLIKTEGKIATQLGLTPLQEKLMFDYPTCYTLLQDLLEKHPLQSVEELNSLPPDLKLKFKQAEDCSYWRGLYEMMRAHLSSGPPIPAAPMFEKIREGQIWRLFTPTLLHRDLLHIIFNMSWLIYLGRQIEERLGKWKFLFLVVIIGIFSNIAQYLMGGPYFLGFSGVAVGLVGFIWMRQRLCPWEGYPLTNGIAMFLLIFVLAMLFLDWVSLALQLVGKMPLATNIANTAHISGGIIGLLLGRIPLFAHKP